MKDVEEAVAQTQIQMEVLHPAEPILKIAEVLRFVQSIHGKCPIQSGRAHLVRLKRGERGKCNGSGLRVPLVQLNPSNFDSGLHHMSSRDPRKIVDLRKGIACP